MKVHVDTGSSVDVMHEQCFNKLPDHVKALVKPTAVSQAGFSGESSWPIGQLELLIELYGINMILGRTALRLFGAISSTLHGMVKFSTRKGVGTLTSVVIEPMRAMITARESIGIEGHAVLAE
ncbi:uncharacterized protein [Rutidosis leptorrhynchoides]|uniref:uncharacterized protein n=1 Tax=Rutidosis leptorrhynchoides TaxID=125765 RepID=UPI003A98E073